MTTLDEMRSLIANLKDANPSVVDLSRVCEQILRGLDSLEKDIEVKASLESFQKVLSHMSNTVALHTKQISEVKTALDAQSNQLFLSDEEHKQMVKHVHSVLDMLEDYLRRHT